MAFSISDIEFATVIILQQLGGYEFIKATGVRDICATDDGGTLRMTLPKNKSNANRLDITRDYATDTYNVRFYKYTPPKMKINHKTQSATFLKEKVNEVLSFEGIYCDQLQEIFSQVTGFDTRMPRIIGFNC